MTIGNGMRIIGRQNLVFWRIAIAASILGGWLVGPLIGLAGAAFLDLFLPTSVAEPLGYVVGGSAVFWIPLGVIAIYCIMPEYRHQAKQVGE